jgi:hypothetical protein
VLEDPAPDSDGAEPEVDAVEPDPEEPELEAVDPEPVDPEGPGPELEEPVAVLELEEPEPEDPAVALP